MSNPARVLVVDDEDVVRELIVRSLTLLGGFEAEGVDSVEAAIEAFDRVAPQVVLTDRNMPGRTGLELLQWIRARHPATAVVLMTGEDHAASAEEARRQGAFDCVTKPFRDLRSLADLVQRALESG